MNKPIIITICTVLFVSSFMVNAFADSNVILTINNPINNQIFIKSSEYTSFSYDIIASSNSSLTMNVNIDNTIEVGSCANGINLGSNFPPYCNVSGTQSIKLNPGLHFLNVNVYHDSILVKTQNIQFFVNTH